MALTIDILVSLCKRRGFVFQSSEIYGGLAATYDYGPLGIALKRNVTNAWWRAMVEQRDDIEGIESAILMHPRVWEASGHVESFHDPLVDCKGCKKRFRADHLWVAAIVGPEGQDWGTVGPVETQDKGDALEALTKKKFKKKTPPEGTRIEVRDLQEAKGAGDAFKCPECGNELTAARQFNLMFRTTLGAVEETGTDVYLRPETAQGMFVNFENIVTTMRRKLPFGIAQIGKSFRNEVTTKSFTYRTLEFEQMEMEYFVMPGTDEEWYKYWLDERYKWYRGLGMRSENMRMREHEKDELAHYARACCDVEYNFPFGWSELEGIANRADYDLKQHAKCSGKRIDYFDQPNDTHLTPYVIEPAAGATRATLAFLCDAYREGEVRGEKRVVLALHPDLAPVKAAVFPLLRNRPELVEKARAIADDLRKRFPARYDDTAAIGKLYRRQDEIGTPLGITVDVDSLEDQCVTVRHRDTMEQDRVPMERVAQFCTDKLDAMRQAFSG
ncbi:glycine--tRNA ligase [Candidatus Sumerlaeota bacterium]|nr:glycine--tRNA ligase [Candidatus Sumerlaeota bacterium]